MTVAAQAIGHMYATGRQRIFKKRLFTGTSQLDSAVVCRRAWRRASHTTEDWGAM